MRSLCIAAILFIIVAFFAFAFTVRSAPNETATLTSEEIIAIKDVQIQLLSLQLEMQNAQKAYIELKSSIEAKHPGYIVQMTPKGPVLMEQPKQEQKGEKK